MRLRKDGWERSERAGLKAVADSEPEHRVDDATLGWQQGDFAIGDFDFVYFVNPDEPVTPAAAAALEAARAAPDHGVDDAQYLISVATPVAGAVVVTQTCDIVRRASTRPFVQVAPLIDVAELEVSMEDVRRAKTPRLAYVPGAAAHGLVADLDMVMTVEKGLLATYQRQGGCRTSDELRAFQQALARSRARFAFPDDFEEFVGPLKERMSRRSQRNSDEGRLVDLVDEIRVRALSGWDADIVELEFLFLLLPEAQHHMEDIRGMVAAWMALLPEGGRYRVRAPIVLFLDDLSAAEYKHSDQLDLDNLSISR